MRIAPELYLKRLIVGGWKGSTKLVELSKTKGLHQTQPEVYFIEVYQAYTDYKDDGSDGTNYFPLKKAAHDDYHVFGMKSN